MSLYLPKSNCAKDIVYVIVEDNSYSTFVTLVDKPTFNVVSVVRTYDLALKYSGPGRKIIGPVPLIGDDIVKPFQFTDPVKPYKFTTDLPRPQLFTNDFKDPIVKPYQSNMSDPLSISHPSQNNSFLDLSKPSLSLFSDDRMNRTSDSQWGNFSNSDNLGHMPMDLSE